MTAFREHQAAKRRPVLLVGSGFRISPNPDRCVPVSDHAEPFSVAGHGSGSDAFLDGDKWQQMAAKGARGGGEEHQ